MKKVQISILGIFLVFTSSAQALDPNQNKIIPDNFIEVAIVILSIYIPAIFIIKIMKMVLDNRLKYKLLEKGVSADVIKEFLKPSAKDTKNEVLKWTTLFVGICVGFTISYFFQPYGNHTVVIMGFSIAASFLIYYNFFYRSSK